jgi:hypothetical protein
MKSRLSRICWRISIFSLLIFGVLLPVGADQTVDSRIELIVLRSALILVFSLPTHSFASSFDDDEGFFGSAMESEDGFGCGCPSEGPTRSAEVWTAHGDGLARGGGA